MASAGSIFVDLLLRDGKYVSGLNRARMQTQQFSSAITRSLRDLTAGFAAAFSVRELIRYSDTFRQLQGRLSLVTNGFNDLKTTQVALLAVAERTRQPLESVTNFYTRLAQFVPEAERAQYDLLGVTESVASALAVTGETSESASAAMIQFTQAIGTNFEAAGQELRSLQEQAPRLTKALMNALGDGTKSLQQLKKEGLLTRESVLNALRGMGEEGRKLAEELARIPSTVGQAFTKLNNEFLNYIGNSSAVTNATQLLADASGFAAKNLDTIIKVIAAVATIIATRLVVSLSLSAAAWAANLTQVVLYQAALARMAGVSLIAAGSATALGSAISLLGGPIGILILSIAALIAYVGGWDKAINGLQVSLTVVAGEVAKFGYAVVNIGEAMFKGFKASFDRIGEILSGLTTGLANFIKNPFGDGNFAELENTLSKGFVSAFTNAYDEVREKSRIFNEGINKDVDSYIKEMAARQAQQSNSSISAIVTPPVVGSTGGTGGGSNPEKDIDRLNKWIVKQKEANQTLAAEIQYIGMASIEVDKLRAAREIDAEFAEKSLNIKGEELEMYKRQIEGIKQVRAELMQQSYDESRSISTGIKEFFNEYAESATNAAANIKNVLGDAFRGVEDAFVSLVTTGKANFKELANSIIQDLIRIQFRKAITGIFGGGSTGGGLLSGLLGGGQASSFAGFFAEGGFIPPGQWGVAGEEGAEAIYGGRAGATVIPQGSGGNTYNIDARGADSGAVARIETALYAYAGPGVVERRVRDANIRGGL